jgi:hypothetical protein
MAVLTKVLTERVENRRRQDGSSRREQGFLPER